MSLFLHYLTLPYLVEGIGFTISVTVLGLLGGLLVGLVLAAMQLSRFWVPAAIARTYTVVFRGTPLVLQLVFVYDALPHMGVKLSALASAGVALAANEGPFIAEILRAGVKGVERGQIMAGQALGMTPSVLMRRIVAPQAIRTMIPALGSESVSALKNSSLASVIAVPELTLRSTQLASSTFDFFAIFFASGLMYLALTGGLSALQILIEIGTDLNRTRRPEGLADLVRRTLQRRKPEPSPRARATATDTPDASRPAKAEPAMAARTVEQKRERAARLAANHVAIELTGLRKAYGSQLVLDGLDFSARFGEVIALLGPSGSGKSTLLRCINHLESWYSGTVRVSGRRLGFDESGRPMSPRAIAEERANVGIGMVFQQFNLFAHLTALENVAGPLRWVQNMSAADAQKRAGELLERVGLSHRANSLPRHLSGGQQQRVAIARALAPNPSVLLLDEPTSALDPELVGEVLAVIRALAREGNLTMIISTHQLRFAEDVADRIALISGGRIVEEGEAHQILTHPQNPITRRFLRMMDAQHSPELVV